jgi:hypothetical protein
MTCGSPQARQVGPGRISVKQQKVTIGASRLWRLRYLLAMGTAEEPPFA